MAENVGVVTCSGLKCCLAAEKVTDHLFAPAKPVCLPLVLHNQHFLPAVGISFAIKEVITELKLV